MKELYWLKYLIVLVITAGIFGSAFALSRYLDDQKLQEIQNTESEISLDILSNETQFDLLAASSCKDLSDPQNSVLTTQLGSLASQLSYTEAERGASDPEVISLKKYYSLLEVKDLILMEKIGEKCQAENPVSIIYFYSNAGDCADCKRTGYVLDELRAEYPALRIYSFDYNLDLSAIKTLIDVYKIRQDQLPALVMKDSVYYGFRDVSNILTIYPEVAKLAATSTATTTQSK